MATNRGPLLKDPASVLDYSFDWSEWLDGDDTLSSASFDINGGDDALLGNDVTNDDTTATVWLSGGTDQVNYEVTCHIVTEGGRTDERTRDIWVRQR